MRRFTRLKCYPRASTLQEILCPDIGSGGSDLHRHHWADQRNHDLRYVKRSKARHLCCPVRGKCYPHLGDFKSGAIAPQGVKRQHGAFQTGYRVIYVSFPNAELCSEICTSVHTWFRAVCPLMISRTSAILSSGMDRMSASADIWDPDPRTAGMGERKKGIRIKSRERHLWGRTWQKQGTDFPSSLFPASFLCGFDDRSQKLQLLACGAVQRLDSPVYRCCVDLGHPFGQFCPAFFGPGVVHDQIDRRHASDNGHLPGRLPGSSGTIGFRAGAGEFPADGGQFQCHRIPGAVPECVAEVPLQNSIHRPQPI